MLNIKGEKYDILHSHHLLYDLYSHWENLYHFASPTIYTPAWGICIILLII